MNKSKILIIIVFFLVSLTQSKIIQNKRDFIKASEASSEFLKKLPGQWDIIYINPISIKMFNPLTGLSNRKYIYEVWAKFGNRSFKKRRVLYKSQELYAMDMKIKRRRIIDRRVSYKRAVSPPGYDEITVKAAVLKKMGSGDRVNFLLLRKM